MASTESWNTFSLEKYLRKKLEVEGGILIKVYHRKVPTHVVALPYLNFLLFLSDKPPKLSEERLMGHLENNNIPVFCVTSKEGANAFMDIATANVKFYKAKVFDEFHENIEKLENLINERFGTFNRKAKSPSLSNRKRPVVRYIPGTTKPLEEYQDAYEAARKLGLDPWKIRNVCEGIRATYGGWEWRYGDEQPGEFDHPFPWRRRPLIARKDGKIAYVFDKEADANRAGFSKVHITKVILGVEKSHKGLTWEYVTDDTLDEYLKFKKAH